MTKKANDSIYGSARQKQNAFWFDIHIWIICLSQEYDSYYETYTWVALLFLFRKEEVFEHDADINGNEFAYCEFKREWNWWKSCKRSLFLSCFCLSGSFYEAILDTSVTPNHRKTNPRTKVVKKNHNCHYNDFFLTWVFRITAASFWAWVSTYRDSTTTQQRSFSR